LSENVTTDAASVIPTFHEFVHLLRHHHCYDFEWTVKLILHSPPAQAISFSLIHTMTLGQSVYLDISLHINNYYIKRCQKSIKHIINTVKLLWIWTDLSVLVFHLSVFYFAECKFDWTNIIVCVVWEKDM
jgi:hypothetical protein